MVRQHEASLVDPVGDRELLHAIALDPERLPSHAPATQRPCLHAVLAETRGNPIAVRQRRCERCERDGADRRARVGLGVEALRAEEPGLVDSVGLDTAGDDALDLPELRQPESRVEVRRPDVEARVVERERTIELEDAMLSRLERFFGGIEVLRPAVRPDLEEDVLQFLVVRADHATLDGRQVMAEEEGESTQLPERSHTPAVVGRAGGRARVLHQEEPMPLLELHHRLHVDRHAEDVDENHRGGLVPLEKRRKVIGIEAELDRGRDRRRPAHRGHDDLSVREPARQERGIIHEQVRRRAGVDEQRVLAIEPPRPSHLELLGERAEREPRVGLQPLDEVLEIARVDRVLGELVALRHPGVTGPDCTIRMFAGFPPSAKSLASSRAGPFGSSPGACGARRLACSRRTRSRRGTPSPP